MILNLIKVPLSLHTSKTAIVLRLKHVAWHVENYKRKECAHFPVFLSFPPDVFFIKAKDYIACNAMQGHGPIHHVISVWFVEMVRWWNTYVTTAARIRG